ncbi:hypothetical protein [Paracoccus aminovorans]|uniref:hypothetical protein n=1 Tax=Paracoccus aminovorans TaxID=34004 RepID=UPI002B25F3EB|nr:hypothetical protein [Paracoccus aminovorans]
MAIHTPIISPCPSEALASFRSTPVTLHFASVMRDFSAYIEAERDLEHCDSWDPACDAWIRDAERARTRVLDAIANLCAAPNQRREDLPLRRCADLAQMLIESDSPEQVRDILALPVRFPDFFRCAGTGLVAGRVDLMVAAFQQHLHALARLPDFTGMVEADDLAIEPDAPNLMLAPAA